ncbi:MAG: transposase, partial [Candidatus Brocadia carolinensis]
KILPREHAELGNLVAIDGSLIDAVLSMHWANYRNDCKKAKVHLGFDMNQSIPSKLFFTDGKADERPFVSQILRPGQTGVMDRYYQCHKDSDLWQTEEKSFVCRIRENSTKTCIRFNAVKPGGIVFYDAIVLLGTPGVNQTEQQLRVIGYRIDNKIYWIATNRYDLSAEELTTIYKLRWNIEIFFGWWKRHLKVYHLIARTKRGLMAQILGGLITYLLLAIYCHEHYQEKVSIKRVRELRIKIQNEARNLKNNQGTPSSQQADTSNLKEQLSRSFAIP